MRPSASSAGLTVSAAVAFASFSKPLLVQARGAKLRANIAARRAKTSLTVAATIALSGLAKPFFVFAGEPQFVT